MFKIYDGRDKFYQWDIDRKLIVEDATIAEVHFCNRTDDCSLVCETYLENGLTVVNVPNVLLQTDWTIRAYAFDKYYTKFEKKYEVVPRTKPTDYVYTETETVNYSALLERMNTIDENIATNVEQYIQENPVIVDLINYYDKQESDDRFALKDDVPDGVATEKYVDNAISKIELMPGKDGDSGVYVGTTEPTEPDKLIWINPEGEAGETLATKQYVDDAIAAAGGETADLSNYYTKDEVNALIPSTSGFITMPDVEAKGYQTEAQVNALIDTALGVIENGSY